MSRCDQIGGEFLSRFRIELRDIGSDRPQLGDGRWRPDNTVRYLARALFGRKRARKLIRLPPGFQPCSHLGVRDTLARINFGLGLGIKPRFLRRIEGSVENGFHLRVGHTHLPTAFNYTKIRAGMQQGKSPLRRYGTADRD